MRIGVIGRADYSGLASMTIDFCNHLVAYVDRALIIYRDNRGDTDRNLLHPGIDVKVVNEITDEMLSQFTEGIDVVVGFETFYNHNVIPIAARKGIRTVMFPMWECSPVNVLASSIIINLSDTDQEKHPTGIRMDWPMGNLDIGYRECQSPPKTFVHLPGGLNDRNNTAVYNAMALRKRSTQYECLTRKGLPTRADLYRGADCMVHLQGFDGLSLPMLEAAQARIPTLVLDIPGFKHYPYQMRVTASRYETYQIGGREVGYFRPSPEHLHAVIEDLALGRRIPGLPPLPNTWEVFEDQFLQLLERRLL